MRRKKEEALETRERLLDAALATFGRKGYALTTLEDVAREAGVTRGAIYWHFGGKAQLYSALVEERFARANQAFDRVLSEGGTPLEVIRRLITRSIEYVEEDKEYREVLELTMFKTEVTPEMSKMMETKAKANKAFVQVLEELVKAGMNAGEIRSNLDPKVVALSAVSLIGGVVSLWLLDPASFSAKAYAAAIADMFVSGIAR